MCYSPKPMLTAACRLPSLARFPCTKVKVSFRSLIPGPRGSQVKSVGYWMQHELQISAVQQGWRPLLKMQTDKATEKPTPCSGLIPAPSLTSSPGEGSL